MIRFTEDVDGAFKAGQVVTLDAGIEDAYVNWRQAAVFVNPQEPTENKSIDAPPKDKMMRKPKAKK